MITDKDKDVRCFVILVTSIWIVGGRCFVAEIMSGRFQFKPSTTSSTAGGTGVGGFSFGTPLCTAAADTCSAAATTASFGGVAAGAGSLFGASIQPAAAASATTAGFTFCMSSHWSYNEFSYCSFHVPAYPQYTCLMYLCLYACVYRVAHNKIPHQTMCNISTTSGLILKILEAA